MITLDEERKVKATAVDFIIRKKRRYEWIKGIHGVVLRQIIFMDWLHIHPSLGPELTSAYDWLEMQTIIPLVRDQFADLLGE